MSRLLLSLLTLALFSGCATLNQKADPARQADTDWKTERVILRGSR